MANKDSAKGFQAVGHLAGGQVRTREYICTTSATIYKGDPLKMVAAGTVEVAAANDGIIRVGVAAEHIASASAGQKIQVWDDPFIIFETQADTGTALDQTCVGSTANSAAYAAGSATTGLSGCELDSSDVETGLEWQILCKAPIEDNEWGEHVKLHVIHGEHLYLAHTLSAGVDS